MPIWRLNIRVTELSIKQLVMSELITRMKVTLSIAEDFLGVFRCQVGSYKPLLHYAICPDTRLDCSLKSTVKLRHKGSVSSVCATETGSGIVLPGHHPQVTVE